MGYIIRLSLANLKLRKLRTALTIFGIMIGIMSIVTMLTAGMGAKQAMIDEVEKVGSTKEIYVTAVSNDRRDKILTDAVVTKLEKLDNVAGVYPVLNASGSEKLGTYRSWSSISGVPIEYMQLLSVEDGSLPVSNGSRPQLLFGKGVRTSLYNEKTWQEYSKSPKGSMSLVGKKIDFYLDPVRVENTEEETKTEKATDTDAEEIEENEDPKSVKLSIVGETDNDYDYTIYTDIDTLKMLLKRNAVNGNISGQPKDKSGMSYGVWVYNKIIVRVDSTDDVERVSKVISDLGYHVENNLEMLNSVNRTIGIVQMVLGAIGAIAAIVAIIGIVNTMMTAVLDRVHEIGLIKMLGGSRDDISFMFLFESALLGAAGGVLGIGLSLLVDLMLNKKLVQLMNMPEGSWIMAPPLWLILASLVMAIIVSVLAGAIPARWAARIKPLDAVEMR